MMRPDVQAKVATVPFMDPAAEIGMALSDAVQAVADSARTHKHTFARIGLALGLTLGLGAGEVATTPIHSHAITADAAPDPQTLEKMGTGTKVALGAGATAAAGLGLYTAGAHLFGWKWPWQNIKIDLGDGQPAKHQLAVDQESYNVTEDFKFFCLATVSVAVRVKAHKEAGLLQANVDLSHIDYGDMGLCGDTSDDANVKGVATTTQLTFTKDKTTGKVTNIEGFYPQLTVYRPRVKHTDPRNCLPTNYNTPLKDAEKMLEKRLDDINNGKNPKCDDGWRMSNSFEPTNANTRHLLTDSYTAAEVAMEIDTNPKDIIKQKMTEYEQLIQDYLKGKYGLTDSQIDLKEQPATDDKVLEAKLLAIKPELDAIYKQIELRNNNGKLELYAVTFENVEITVELSSTDAVSVKDLVEVNMQLADKSSLGK